MSQTTTPSGAEILGALDNALRPLNRPRKQSEFNELFKARTAVAALIARNAELEAELATLKEEWFMCCHPAWPDPLPCWGGKADAIDTINRYPHPDAWLLRTLRGGRIEYKGADLEALARTPANGGDDE